MLSKTCAQVCVEELSLQADHDFVVKVVQFQELLDVRHRYSKTSLKGRVRACGIKSSPIHGRTIL